MGLNTQTASQSQELFGFTFQERCQIDDQLGRVFFSEGRLSEGLHTIAYIPANLILTTIVDKTTALAQLSTLYDTDNPQVIRLQNELSRVRTYASAANDYLDTLSPDSWKEFFASFCLPLKSRSKQALVKMKESLQSRMPMLVETKREGEYECMHEAMKAGILDHDFIIHARKRLAPKGAREYAIKAIVASLRRIYNGNQGIVNLQEKLLRHDALYPEALMFYAYVLSAMERKDVFSSYAVRERCLNDIQVGWDFDTD